MIADNSTILPGNPNGGGPLYTAGQFICFLACVGLFLGLYGLGRIDWGPLPPAAASARLTALQVYSAYAACSAIAFLAGVLLLYRRLAWAVAMLLLTCIAAAWLMPDR